MLRLVALGWCDRVSSAIRTDRNLVLSFYSDGVSEYGLVYGSKR